jgi:hypothetical protein
MMTPRCLEHFNFSRVPHEWRDVRNLVIQLTCKSCGHGAFGLTEILSGDSPTGIAPTCEACGQEAVLFDGKQHGYDGELGHIEHLEGD